MSTRKSSNKTPARWPLRAPPWRRTWIWRGSCHFWGLLLRCGGGQWQGDERHWAESLLSLLWRVSTHTHTHVRSCEILIFIQVTHLHRESSPSNPTYVIYVAARVARKDSIHCVSKCILPDVLMLWSERRHSLVWHTVLTFDSTVLNLISSWSELSCGPFVFEELCFLFLMYTLLLLAYYLSVATLTGGIPHRIKVKSDWSPFIFYFSIRWV